MTTAAIQPGPWLRPLRAAARCPLSWPILVFLAVIAGPASAQQCLAPPSGAVYWLAGENSFDDLARFHHGSSGDTGVAFVPGQVGTAMRFDGIEDRVVANVTPAEQIELRNTFSYEMWVRPTASLGSCPQSNTSNCSGVQLRWTVFPSLPEAIGLADASGFGIGVGTNGICAGEHAANLVNCLARLDTPINDWSHIVVVVEDKTPRIYLNGELAHSGIASNKSFLVASWQVIGSGLGLGAFAGDLDEFTVYNRALGDAEIAALFAAGSAGKCKESCPMELSDDAWQGALVTSHTPLSSDSPDCLFGATDCSPEPTSILFADDLPDGTVHSIEWQTATPVALNGFVIFAAHDNGENLQRKFRHFRLQARMIGDSFATFYESPVVVPYGQGVEARELLRCPSLRPLQAQQFRAEFVQDGAGGLSGPRVIELDGLTINDLIFTDRFE